ncbi:ImmA/IrrE family metallo-endopeptidase [Bacillus sp. S2(2019)]|uniref:ImmA/IrrE family metallo-endopeptidase n=1 Tax=Bacillus TaxID=1386 RepID=UPI0010AEBDD4|nr:MULTISPECIES: ImmA/IrrE family metallo-endopeptidase [Bacillus]MCY7581445.1 ImmA/IrrE family metallo-endopeptidase [Bacillus altitudinis]MCY7594447.1 ImmA/IrrE family metallo-endopeptidase [Bacillus altitudinis]MED0852454.1 ImmA/IrrE family metallo-endopeptidase [Bacillus altitudinis]QII23573.1 ImmA/IrrE family metallo-endopeptidase [Bacillus altitudinis]TKD55663.1 ImmA/IrrE family metallo-endopeptidase [Bacillus sp. S2(2019)]
MGYVKSHLEEWIEDLYRSINIQHSHQINFEQIAESLGLNVRFSPQKSFGFRALNKYVIVLDKRKTRQEQWLDFAHELCHIYRHENDIKIMPGTWNEYNERQATYFAYHFCVPSFMLKSLSLPPDQNKAALLVADIFKVTCEFAKRRLCLYYNKIKYY